MADQPRTWPIFGVLFLFVSLIVAGVLWRMAEISDEESAPSQRPKGVVVVEATPLTHGTVEDRLNLSGSLEPSVRQHLSFQVSGPIVRWSVDVGDVVEKGQTLATLDASLLDLEVRELEAAVVLAQARLAQSRSEETVAIKEGQRMDFLFDKRVISESEVEQSKAKVSGAKASTEVLQAQLAMSKVQLESAKTKLGFVHLKAQWEGDDLKRVVSERVVEEGEMVGVGQKVLTLLSIFPIKAMAHLSEQTSTSLQVGQKVDLKCEAWPGRVFTGEVERFAPEFQSSSRQRRVEFNFPNDSGDLLPGMFVELSVLMKRFEHATLVPESALVQRGGQPVIYLIPPETSTVQRREVQLGLKQEGRVQILTENLQGQVVTLGHHLLKDGMVVKVKLAEVTP